MGKKSIYTIDEMAGAEGVYAVIKCDEDYNQEEQYFVSEVGNEMICTCFAGGRPTCRHRQMLRKFQAEERVGQRWYYQFDKQKWIPPVTLEE